MPNATFSLDDVVSVSAPPSGLPPNTRFPNPYAPPVTPTVSTAPPKPPQADFSLDDVISVSPVPQADFSLDDVVSVKPAPRVYTPTLIKSTPDAELVADKAFEPVNFGRESDANLVAIQSDPELRDKIRRVYRQRETEGTTVKEKLKALTNVGPVVEALYEGAVATGKASLDLSAAGLARPGGIKQAEKSAAEVAASVENAEAGAGDLIRRSARSISEGIADLPAPIRGALKYNPITGVQVAALDVAAGRGISNVVKERLGGEPFKSKAEMSDQDWDRRYFDDVEQAKQVEAAGKANGAWMTAIGFDAGTLERDYGIKVDPVVINEMSAITDPLNIAPIGGALGVVGKIGGKMFTRTLAITGNTARAAELAKIFNAGRDAIIKKGVGNAVARAGEVVEGGAARVQSFTKSAGGTVSGLGLGSILGGDIYSALGGAAVVKGVPAVTKAVGAGVRKAGEMIAGRRAVPGALQLAADTATGAVGGFVKGAAEGAVLTLPFEIGARPDEEQFLLGAAGLGGVTRGGIDAVSPTARIAGRVAQNKLAETIFRHVEQADMPDSPAYGVKPELDTVHSATMAKQSKGQQNFVSLVRELGRAAGLEVYAMDGTTFIKNAGRDALGYTIRRADRVGPDGVVKPVVEIYLNTDAESLAHEFFHALEDLDPKNAKAFTDSVGGTMTPEQRVGFAALYNSRINGGKPEKLWTLKYTPDEIVREAAAEVFSRIFNAQDLSGVEPSVVQKGALFASSILEKLGAPLGGINKSRKDAGVSHLGVRPSTEQVKAGQAWLNDLLGRVNDSGTLGEPPKKINFPTVDNAADIPFQPFADETPAPVTITPEEIKPAETPAPVAVAPEEITPVVPPPAETTPTPPPVTLPTTPEKPVNPPLPRTPAGERIRTTDSDYFVGKRAEGTNFEKAKAAAQASKDDRIVSIVNEVQPHVEAKQPVEIVHSGAKSENFNAGRTERRAEVEEKRRVLQIIKEGLEAAPDYIRNRYSKVTIPYAWDVRGKNVIQVLAMSLDKVFGNLHKAVKDIFAKGLIDEIPYEVSEGKLTEAGWSRAFERIQNYTANQANGFRGDGLPLVRPESGYGLDLPKENPDYSPVLIPEKEALFLNLIMGVNPPLTAREVKGSVPGNVKGQILAEVNSRTPEKPVAIRPSDINKQTFSSGREIKETNPLRNKLAEAGVDVRELIEVTERINVADIETVTPRPDLNFEAPVTDTIRGGFLPADLISNELEKIVRGESDGVTFNADGTVFSPGDRKLDVVTLASKNVSLAELTPEEVRAAVSQYSDLLSLLDTKPGIFKMSNGREVSIDLNVVVDQKHRDNTLKFARDNNQEAIFDFVTFESVPTGGTGKTILTDPAAISDAARKLVNGEPVEVKKPSRYRDQGRLLPTVEEISAMSEDEFSTAAKGWTGGLTTKAHEVGKATTTPEGIERLSLAQAQALENKKRLMAAKDYAGAMSESTRAQFFREAHEAATNTGGTAEELVRRKGDFLPETEPQSEAGKELTGRGFTLKIDPRFYEPNKGWMFTVEKNGKQIGELQARISNKNRAELRWVRVDPDFRRQGVASALYKELGSRLQSEGVTELVGQVEGEGIKELREKVFGSAEQLSKKKVLSEINPQAKFLPGRKVDPAMEVFRKANPDWEYPSETDLNDLVIQPKSKAKAPKNNTSIGAAAWILPDGEVRSFKDAAFHEQDLAANYLNYNKRFGTKFGAEASIEDRLAAVNAGFVRIRNAPGRGLVVEASADRWNSIKPKLAKVLADNADNTVMLSVALLNRKGNEVAGDSLRLAGKSDRAGAIKELLNGLKPPSKEGAPIQSDVQRMRSLPGDFLPAESDAVDKPAMRTKDGRIFTGSWHGEALLEAIKAGLDQDAVDSMSDGWTTKGGDFLTRTQAYDRAVKLKQMPTPLEYGSGLHSGFLESNDFENKRKFLPADNRDIIFYSELQKVVEEKVKGKTVKVNDLGNLLRNSGVKAEEIKWSGLDDFARGKESVDTSELKQWLKTNDVRIEEVVKGENTSQDTTGWTAERDISKSGNDIWRVYDADHNQVSVSAERSANSAEAIRRASLNDKSETKFENYQVPGGENYKELLLTLPLDQKARKQVESIKQSIQDDIAVSPELLDLQKRLKEAQEHGVASENENPPAVGYGKAAFRAWADTDPYFRRNPDDVTEPFAKKAFNTWAWRDLTENLQAEWGEKLQEKFGDRYSQISELTGQSQAATFKSSHWDEPNVLAHVRFNERTDANGNRVLFVEEVQSDWHQKGRSQGYAGTLTEKDLPPGWTLTEKHGLWDVRNANGELNNYNENKQSALAIALGGQPGAVPDAPFKKTWPLLAVKRMIRYAAEHEFDKIAWTPGEIQAERYDLSKHIDTLRVSKLKDGMVGLDALGPAPDYRLVISQSVPMDKVADHVGKELATKIRDQKENYHEYEGIDLKVGGEGMRGFYDEILPKEVGNYVKKWGSKVEKTGIPGIEGDTRLFSTKKQAMEWAQENLGRSGFSVEVDTPTQKWRVYDMTSHGPVRDLKNLEAWSLKITPEMKTDVLTKGQKKFLPSDGVEIRRADQRKSGVEASDIRKVGSDEPKFSPKYVSAPDGVPDVLDAMYELGGIASPRKAKFPEGGEYDGYNQAFGEGIARLLRKYKSGRGMAPDELRDALVINYGFRRLDNTSDLYEMVQRASRRGKKLGQSTVEKWSEKNPF